MHKLAYLSTALLVMFMLFAPGITFADPGNGGSSISKSAKQRKPLADYVNPFIGTTNAGDTFPGPTMPHGMVQLSPDTGRNLAGYVYTDDHIDGFSFTHLSGAGCWGLGNFLTTATTGVLKTTEKGYRSSFSHDQEEASPGYYSVMLKDYGIKTELTATTRTGLLRYTFPASDQSRILFDASHTLENTPVSDASVKVINNQTIVGSQTDTQPFCGGTTPYKVYFAAKFSKPFKSYGTWNGDNVEKGSNVVTGKDVGAFLNYDTKKGEQVLVKVGISFVSTDQAMLNLKTEVPGWDFNKVKKHATDTWNKKLSSIEVYGGSQANKVKFYTALYHVFMGPYTFSDVNGKYIGMDDKIYTAKDHIQYHTFSLWDTFRAEHPLIGLLEPKRQVGMIKSLLNNYKHGGWLPLWPMVNRYTNCMISDHATSVIAAAIANGFDEFDRQEAFKAMLHNETQTPPSESDYVGMAGLKYFETHGYVPLEADSQAVSITLENSYTSYAMAQAAKKLGKTDEYNNFMARADNFINVFNPQSGWMHPRYKDGSWKTNFDPKDGNGFTEGDSWTYSWFVPQDARGLVQLMGKDQFTSKLDHFFAKFRATGGDSSNYWHGNEPDQQAPYLYDYVGQPWKTQEVTQRIMDKLYGTESGGIPGNDDLGQMSAWYVFSAMGFYPVSPADGTYEITSPQFRKVVIHLPDYHYGKKKFVIKANGYHGGKRYIESAHLNGKPLKQAWFSRKALTQGGTLEFAMGANPNKHWGTDPDAAPPSMTTKKVDPAYQGFDLSSSKVDANEPLKVTATIKNNGGIGTSKVNLYVDGNMAESKKVVFDAGETKKVTFTTRLYKGGDHQITVGDLDAKTVTVHPMPAKLAYHDFQVTSQDKPENVTAKATVKNIGSYKATKKVTFYVNGDSQQTKTVTLGPGESTSVSFSYTFDESGIQWVRIGAASAQPVKIPGVVGIGKPALSLDFDKGSGTTVSDVSGNGNNGTIHGSPKWVDGKFGKALQFESSNDWVEVPDSPSLDTGNGLTLTAWVNLDDPQANQKIFGKTSIGNGYLMGVQNGGLYPETWDTSGTHYTFTKGSIPANQWVQLAFTWKKGGRRIGYINGKEVANLPASDQPLKSTDNPLFIGGAPWNPSSFSVHGMVDEVSVYNRALSPAAIQQLYQHNSTGKTPTYTTEWRNLSQSTSLDSLQAVTDIGQGEGITATVQVSDDGQKVTDEKTMTFADGKKSYDLSGLKGSYVRIKTEFNGDSPYLDDLVLTGNGVKESWQTISDWAKGSWTPSIDIGYVTFPQSPQPVDSSVLTPTSGAGHGLTAEYFNNMDLSGDPVLTRVDPQINFDWGLGSPASGINKDQFSARWTGTLTAPSSGTYNFFLTSDDASRLYIDGNLVVDNWGNHSLQTKSSYIRLNAGQTYNIKVEYYDNSVYAVAKLGWVKPAQ